MAGRGEVVGRTTQLALALPRSRSGAVPVDLDGRRCEWRSVQAFARLPQPRARSRPTEWRRKIQTDRQTVVLRLRLLLHVSLMRCG